MIDEQLLLPPNKLLPHPEHPEPPKLEPPQNNKIRIKKRQLLLPPNVDPQPQPQLDKSPMLNLQNKFYNT